jgi:PAS domain S-box-containing protein
MQHDTSSNHVPGRRDHAAIRRKRKASALQVQTAVSTPLSGVETHSEEQSLLGTHPREGETVALLHSIVELASDATVVVDQDGRIILVNQLAEVLFGYMREELIGQSVELLIPQRFHAAHRRERVRYAAKPHTRPLAAGLRLVGCRRDSSEFPVEVSLSPLPADTWDQIGGAGAVICSVRDITERLRLEAARAAAEASSVELRALQALSDAALSHLELEELLPALLDRIVALLRADTAAVLLVESTGERLEMYAARGLEAEVAAHDTIPVGRGFAGRIAASRAPLVVDDTATFDMWTPILREQVRSVAGVPLIVEGRLVGVLHVGTRTARHFSEIDVSLLRLVADRVALAVDRARLYAAEREARAAAEAALARATASEAQAAERAERLHTILETMTDGVFVYDQEGHVVQSNRAYRELIAADRMPEIEALPVEERTRLLDMRDIATGEPLPCDRIPGVRALGGEVVTERDPDCRIHALDGRELEVNLSAAPLRDSAGRVVGAVSVVRDVTWFRRLEREGEEARAQELATREVNQRMEQFLATAAHDVRAPLSVVTGFLDLTQQRVQRLGSAAQRESPALAHQVEAVRSILEEVENAAVRLARLVAVLFDTAALRAGKLELRRAPCDLAELVGEQVEGLCVAAPERTIHIHVPDEGALLVTADADRIAQVIANYLTNALKYSAMDRPVEVTVETCREVLDEVGESRVARVAVCDAGPGLPKAEQVRVWEPFHRAPGVTVRGGALGNSMGLGLHVCKAIVEAHGGRVGVESAVGSGSTFWFTLPLAMPALIPHACESTT